MVEQQNFHEQLLVTACGHDDIQNIGTSVEHRQQLALDILTWVTAIKLNQPHKMYVMDLTHFSHNECTYLYLQSTTTRDKKET